MTLDAHITDFLTSFADEFQQRLERRTPVDTGHAQESYEQTINTDRVEIVNNVDYIVRLENGHSEQAPLGMLRITLEESQDIANQVLKKQ